MIKIWDTFFLHLILQLYFHGGHFQNGPEQGLYFQIFLLAYHICILDTMIFQTNIAL